MSSASGNDFKKRKELEEARKAGTAEVTIPHPLVLDAARPIFVRQL
jgi:hypothetical protein